MGGGRETVKQLVDCAVFFFNFLIYLTTRFSINSARSTAGLFDNF